MRPYLKNLDEDVLHRILCLCDVFTVLSVSQANKNFKRIASAKHLWICLIKDLAARRLIDLPHNRSVTDYSANELIEEVKRVVLGPKTWSHASPTGPMASQELWIPRTRTGEILCHWLLPGGKYLLTNLASSHIELWDVLACVVIWSPRTGFTRWFRVEIIDGGTAIFVGLESLLVVRVIMIPLDTGDSTELFRIEAPVGTIWNGCPEISGDFFLVHGRERYFVIGNWRTEATVVLRYELFQALAEFAAGHIFFTTMAGDPSTRRHLRLFALSANECLTRHQPNRPLSTYDAISIYDIPAVVVHDLTFSHNIYHTALVVLESPLRDDTHNCTILLVGDTASAPPKPFLQRVRQRLSSAKAPLPERPCILYTFHLSTSGANHNFVHWRLASSAAGEPSLSKYTYSHISYAGYVDAQHDSIHRGRFLNLHLHDPRTVRERDQAEERALLPAPSEVVWTRYLSPHSHAVVTHTDSHYVISYYL